VDLLIQTFSTITDTMYMHTMPDCAVQQPGVWYPSLWWWRWNGDRSGLPLLLPGNQVVVIHETAVRRWSH